MVGWPLALMCFGPKHRSGCALHVSTSGANKRRNRDLSSKPNHLLGTSQESWPFALPRSGAGITRVEGEFSEVWIGTLRCPYRVQALFALSAQGKTRLDNRLDGEIDHKEAEDQSG